MSILDTLPNQPDQIDSVGEIPGGDPPRTLLDRAASLNIGKPPTIQAPDGVDPRALQALLSTIRSTESSLEDNAYSMLFGGDEFTNRDTHPNIRKTFQDRSGNEGITTAAGAYQITKGTFDDFAERTGITGFSSADQDKLAIAILEDTGAIDALKAGDYEAALAAAGKRWVGVGGRLANDSNQYSESFDRSLKRFNGFLNGEEDMPDAIAQAGSSLRQASTSRGTLRGQLFSDINPDKFAPYMLGIDLTQDVHEVRAQNQSNWEQFGHGLVRTPFNMVLGVAEGAGYLLDMEAVGKTLALGTLGRPQYHNWLSDLAKSGKEGMNESLPIYREQASKVWNPGDGAWWMDHGFSLVESIGSFFVLGAGLAAGTSRLAAGVANLANMMAKGTNIARGGAQIATAGGLAYVEGAMEGTEVFDQVYQLGLDQGMTDTVARAHAADAAANTVRINTFVNTGLNMTGAMAFFRPMRSQSALKQAGLSMNPGEAMGAYLARLKDSPARGMLHTLLRDAGREAPQEALEEVVNEISRAEGLFKGEQALGGTDTRDLVTRIVDIILTPEAALAATLGAIGGAGQALVTGLAPSMRLKEGDGSKSGALYKRIQTRGSRDHAAIMEAQTATRNELINVIEGHMDARKRMQEASETGDIVKYRKAQDDLFDTITEQRIISGMEEQLMATYEEIEKMSEEDAQSAGFDTNPESDSYYKKISGDRIQKTKKLVSRWNEIQDTYNFNTDEHLSRLPYFIFGSEVKVESLKEQIKEHKKIRQQIVDAQAEVSTFGDNEWMTFSNLLQQQEQSNAFEKQMVEQQKKIESVKRLAKTEPGRKKLIQQYNTYDIDSIVSSMEDAYNNLGRQQTEINQEFQQLNKDIVEQGGAEVFRQWVGQNQMYKEALERVSANEAAAQSDLTEISTSLNKVLSNKGRKKFSAAFNKELDRLQQIQKERVKEEIRSAETLQELEQLSKQVDREGTPVDVMDELERQNAKLFNQELKEERDRARELGKIQGEQEDLEAKLGVNQERFNRRPFEDQVEREMTLQMLLDINNTADLHDAYINISQAFDLDDDFKKTMALRIKQLSVRNRQTPTTKEDGDAALDLDDSASKTEKPVANQYRSFDDLDEDIDQREEDTPEKAPNGKPMVDGRLIVPAAHAMAHKTKAHAEKVRMVDGKPVFTKVDVDDTLSSNLIPETLDHRHLQPGDEVIFEEDTEFVHPTTGITYAELAEGPDAWRRVPLKVVYHGKTVGWLHDMDWVERNENGEPINVAKSTTNDPKNWQNQIKKLESLRKKVLSEGSIETIVAHHGIGQLNHSYARDESGEIIRDKFERPIKERRRVQDNMGSDVRFIVSRNGQFFEGKDPSKKEIVNENVFPSGQPGVLVPTSSTRDGKQLWMAIPLWLPTLSDYRSEMSSDIFELIRAFHGPESQEEVDQLSDVLDTQFGNDVKLLSQQLGQLFHSANFKASDVKNPKENSKKVFFHVGEDTGDVKIARHAAANGGGIIYTTNPRQASERSNHRFIFELAADGSLLYQQEVEEMIGDVFIDMKFRKANLSSTNIRLITYRGGKWASSMIPYNEFLRNSFQTTVKGDLIADDKWTYFSQPNIIFENPERSPAKQVAKARPQVPETTEETMSFETVDPVVVVLLQEDKITLANIFEAIENRPFNISLQEQLVKTGLITQADLDEAKGLVDAERSAEGETGPKVAAGLNEFLMSDEELSASEDAQGVTQSQEEADIARNDSPFFNYPSVTGIQTLSEQMQADGDIRVTCKV